MGVTVGVVGKASLTAYPFSCGAKPELRHSPLCLQPTSYPVAAARHTNLGLPCKPLESSCPTIYILPLRRILPMAVTKKPDLSDPILRSEN